MQQTVLFLGESGPVWVSNRGSRQWWIQGVAQRIRGGRNMDGARSRRRPRWYEDVSGELETNGNTWAEQP